MDFDPLLGVEEAYLLERERRLSRSLLWDLQRRFYSDSDVFASGVVPLYATTNAFIAERYARLIGAFALRCDAPVTVVELGAGHGRFGYLCLARLLDRARRAAEARGGAPEIRYVLTDISERSVDAWLAHPRFAAMFESGQLDVARFDAERDDRLRLRCSGQEISPESPCGPLIAVANYVFDGLSQDAFRIRGGALEEGLVSLVSEAPWPDVDAPGLLATLSALFTFSPLDEPVFYQDPDLDRVLSFYREHLGDGAFSFPLGAIHCLRRLDAFSEGPTLVISTDKAHNHLSQLRGQHAPWIATHGSVSMMTNHHAIGRYVEGGGGAAMFSSPRAGDLETAAFSLDASLPGLAGDFADAIEDFSPSDYLALFKSSTPDSLLECLKLLRLSGWDPGWICELAPRLRAGLEGSAEDERAELRRGLARAATQTFSIGDSDQAGVIASLREAVRHT